MIRHATKYDMPMLLEMMKEYSALAPQAALKNKEKHNENHVQNLFTQMLAGKGFILIDDQHRGFIASLVITNVWCPDIYELHVLAWLVKREYKGSTIPGRLWKEFDRIAKDMIEDGRIDIVYSSILASSGFVDFNKRGYSLSSATFYRE
jgi:hypothetical protein